MNDVKPVPKIFDRSLLKLRRGRAAKKLLKCNFLHDNTAYGLLERIKPVSIDLQDFLVLGGHSAKLCEGVLGHYKKSHVYWSDLSYEFLSSHSLPEDLESNYSRIVSDEENLPFSKDCLDSIISNLSLHSVNDLKGFLLQSLYSLKPRRPFLCAVFGSRTLESLKKTIMNLEIEETGLVTPRISPFVDIRVLGDLMQSLGFVDVTIDSEVLDIQYSDLKKLLFDVRGMGETNVLHSRDKSIVPKAFFSCLEEEASKGIDLQVEILYVMSWSRDKVQS